MNIEKWDGITDADLIFDALTHFISKSDVEAGLCRSYGDFGNDIHRKYSNSVGTDNENYKVAGYNNRIEVGVVKKNVVFLLTEQKSSQRTTESVYIASVTIRAFSLLQHEQQTLPKWRYITYDSAFTYC